MKNKGRFKCLFVILCVCAALLLSGCARYSFLRHHLFADKISEEGSKGREPGPADLPAYLKTAERPDGFSEAVIEKIKQLKPADSELNPGAGDLYEEKDVEQMECPKNPYEILTADPDVYINAAVPMIERYFASYMYEDTETIDELNIPKEKEYSYIEVQHQQVLAGGQEKFAVAAVVKIHDVDRENTIYTQFGRLGNDSAVHCNLTVYAEHTSDYSYTMKGIADTDEVCAAIEEKFQPVRAAAVPASDGGCKIENKTLMVTYDGKKEWKSVPVTMDKLFCTDGYAQQAAPPKGSYYISTESTFFVYGGREAFEDSPAIPVTMLISQDCGESWKTKELSGWGAVRRIYAGMSGDGKLMYVLMCGDKTMGVEGTSLLVSLDKGKTWEDMGSANGEGSFLVSGAAFFDSSHGLTAVTDHEKPAFYYTSDGGRTWENVRLKAPEEGYTMVYAPGRQKDEFVFYVGQDGYGELEGTVYKYVSRDKGITWEQGEKMMF